MHRFNYAGVCLIVVMLLTGFAGKACAGDVSVLFEPFGEHIDNNYFWFEFFPAGSYADDDIYAVNNLSNNSNLILGKDQVVGSFTIDTGVYLNLKPDGLDTHLETLTVKSGKLIAKRAGHLRIELPIAFSTTANISGFVEFKSSVIAPDGMTLNGGLQWFREGGILQTPTLTIRNGTVDNRKNSAINHVTIGNGIGSLDHTTATYYDKSVGARTSGISVNSDGDWSLFGTALPSSLNLNGGQVLIGDDATLVLPSIVTAAPGLLVSGDGSTSKVKPSTIEPFGQDEPGQLSLGGRQVGFYVQSAHESADALHIKVALKNGSIVKVGDGTMTLDAAVSNEQSFTAVAEGALKLQMTDSATALPSDVIVGSGSANTPPDHALLISAADNQIADDASVTIARDGTWKLGGFTEKVGGLELVGGQISGGGQLTLGGDLTSTSTPRTAAVAVNVSLDGASRVFDIEHDSSLSMDVIFSGVLSNGTLQKMGDGVLRLSGGLDNQITNLLLTEGTLELDKTSGRNAVGNDLNVGVTHQASGGPTLRWVANNQLPDSMVIKFRSGVLDLNGRSDTVGGVNGFGTGGMSLRTSGGTLTLTGTSSAFAGSHVQVDSSLGKLDLGGGTRDFEAWGGVGGSDPNFTNWTFTGQIENGTFRKTGIGRVVFNNVTGDAVLQMDNGSVVITNGATFRSLTGSAPVTVNSGALVIDLPTGRTGSYIGTLGGAGQFIKRGEGTFTLNGAFANTIGTTTVEGGKLVLNKAAVPAVVNLTIGEAGTVQTLSSSQFTSNARITINGGQLLLNSRQHAIGGLSMTGGVVSHGALTSSGSVTIRDGSLEDLTVDITSGGLVLNGSASAAIRGHITGGSEVFDQSSLVIGQSDAAAPELVFTDTLWLHDGTRLVLKPTTPNGAALLSVLGGLGAGDLLLVGRPPTFIGFSGKAIVDLSLAGDLAPGIYHLIDFGTSPFPILGMYATLDQFELISASTAGVFSLQNHVLSYTVVPEPATIGVLAIALGEVAIARPRRSS